MPMTPLDMYIGDVPGTKVCVLYVLEQDDEYPEGGVIAFLTIDTLPAD